MLLTIERDEFTDRLERGLLELVACKKEVETKLARIWAEAYTRK